MLTTLLALVALGLGVAAIVWGAETFAEHLTDASARLGVSTFALALLLAGAEPEELATSVTAALRGVPAIAYGEVIGRPAPRRRCATPPAPGGRRAPGRVRPAAMPAGPAPGRAGRPAAARPPPA
jgi:Sodium/calcium exchanger protein